MKNLDIRTKLFLHITHAKIVNRDDNAIIPEEIEIGDATNNDVYVFENFEEYVNFFKIYLNKVDKFLIELAIHKRGKQGQIIASKYLCERIIVRQKTKEFYASYDQEKIDEIHARGKITPLEKVEEYESHDLCAPGDAIGSSKDRCRFFKNCHECLLEYLSHNEEYDRINLKLIRDTEIEKALAKKA